MWQDSERHVHPFFFADSEEGEGNRGITLREWFAGLAMQGLSANTDMQGALKTVAMMAVQQADALIAELNRPKEQKP